MLADTAIAVHPDDERYTRLVGETAILPLVGRRLTIIADPYVKPEFGTGALKITPGPRPERLRDRPQARPRGDLRDRRGRPHDRRRPASFAGMTALEAREAVVAALREEGRIARTEPYVHNVPFSHRSGERIEPLISLQWFMRMDELAAARARARARRAPADQARGPAAALRRVAGEHPALVRLAPAVVGPPDPRLLPRRGDLRGPRAAGGRGLGARPGRARHLVLEPAVAVRDARLARRHPAAARLLPDRRALDGARHPLPLGRPDGDDGPRVHGRDPVLARERAHGHPGPRRAPDVQVARHRASTRCS